MLRNTPVNAGDKTDSGSIPGSGGSPEGGRCYPLQYSCLENSMDRGAWQAMIHSCLTLCDPMTIQSMEFSRPEYWSVQLQLQIWRSRSLRDLPNPGIEPRSPALQEILYQLNHRGSPRILEWVAMPYSRGSS